MTIKEGEAEIVGVKEASFAPGLTAKLPEQLGIDTVATGQATLAEARIEEVEVHRAALTGEKPRRAGD